MSGPPSTGTRTAPLTPEQLGLWLHDEVEPGSSLYVEPVCLVTADPVDADRLADALRRALAAHPVFGAGLRLVDGLPELVLDRHPPTVRRVELPDAEALDAAVTRQAYRPFDTAAEPLTRATVLTAGDATAVLLVWHHLVVDAWSLRLLLTDLGTAYADPVWAPAPPSTTVCDLARRRVGWAAGPAGDAAVAAAVARVRDVPPPAGPAGPAVPAVVARPVRTPAAVLRAAAQGTVTELAAAAYVRALGVTCGLDELVVGCASVTRADDDEFDVAGYAVNTVLLRCADLRTADWPDLRAQVRRELRRAVAEQAPFAAVARDVLRGSATRPGAYPAFYLDSVVEAALVTGDVRWRQRELPRPAGRFPVCLTLRQHADGTLSVLVEADGRLLDPAGAEALAAAVTGQLDAHVQGGSDASGRAATGR